MADLDTCPNCGAELDDEDQELGGEDYCPYCDSNYDVEENYE